MRKNRFKDLFVGAAISLLAVVSISSAQIVISEIHYHPLEEGTVDGDEFEFIELTNVGDSTVSLTGYAFNTGITYTFPSKAELGPGEFLVLAYNAEYFEQRYGFAPFGVFTGHLSNSGEKIVLMNTTTKTEVFSVKYETDSPWPEAADGAGFSLVMASSDGSGDPNDASWWRVSTAIGGSPGEDDPAQNYDAMKIRVNEILANPGSNQKDAIELYNTHSKAVDISGWYLTDKKSEPKKFKIPDGTVMEPKSYIVFDADDFNPDDLGFALSAHGEGVYLFPVDKKGELTGQSHGFEFGETSKGVSVGRVEVSSGEEFFVNLEDVTLGSKNSAPWIGPLVISEINYNAEGGADYVELINISDLELTLYDPEKPLNTWTIGGLSFSFPQSVVLDPGEVVLVISDSVSINDFRMTYNVPSSVKVFRYAGNLSKNGEELRVEMPSDPYVDGTETIVPYYLIDLVAYGTKAPWPQVAPGKSIVRINLRSFGCEPENWREAEPSPGNASLSVDKGRISRQKILSGIDFNFRSSEIRFSSPSSGPAQIQAFDLNGKCLFRKTVSAKAGNNCFQADLPSQSSGTRIIQVRKGEQIVTGKFLMP